MGILFLFGSRPVSEAQEGIPPPRTCRSNTTPTSSHPQFTSGLCGEPADALSPVYARCLDLHCRDRLRDRLSRTAYEPPDALVGVLDCTSRDSTTVEVPAHARTNNPIVYGAAVRWCATDERREAGCSLATGFVPAEQTDPQTVCCPV